MKKWIAFTLCICMLALAGCGKTEEKKDLLVETASGASETAVGEKTQETAVMSETSSAGQEAAMKQENVTLAPADDRDHTGEVPVWGPADWQCRSYRIESLSTPLEELAEILLPGDTTHTVTDERGHSHLESDSGMTLRSFDGVLSLEKTGEEEAWKYLQIQELLLYRAAAHPEEMGGDLDFMPAKEAQTMVEDLIRKLHMPVEPQLEFSMAMDHQALMDYQQELLKNNPYYDPFGNITEFTDLTEKDDSYYLKFSFTLEGQPVYCEEYRNLSSPPILGSNQFPRFSLGLEDRFADRSVAEAIVTPEGIQYFEIYGTVGKAEPEEALPMVDAKTAAETLHAMVVACPKNDGEQYQLKSVRFSLVPFENRQTGERRLVPLWGAEPLYQKPGGGWVHVLSGPAEFFLNPATGEDAYR